MHLFFFLINTIQNKKKLSNSVSIVSMQANIRVKINDLQIDEPYACNLKMK